MSTVSTPSLHIDTVLSYASDSVGHESIITRSWKRCILDYGLDPAKPAPPRFVPRQVLREHQDHADELINVARAGVEQLYRHIAELGYVILLTDSRGITVQFLGDPLDETAHRKTGLYLGADWSENHAGTCAVGTCIKEQQPLTCHHHDHFSAHHIALTCTAVPIFNPQGQLLAVLDISALNSPPSKDSQQFALQLVKQYARMIEDAYFLRRYREAHILCFDRSREFVLINRQYLLAIAGDGSLLAANTAARALLAECGLQLPERPSALARRIGIQDLFDCEPEDIFSIPRASPDQVRAFRTHRQNALFFAALMEPCRAPVAPQAQRSSQERCPLDELSDDDPAMRKMLARAKRLCSEPLNVLLNGETGTGKERLARALHDSSNRHKAPFVAINCAAMPESLIESELFGYQPGSFTGARSKGMRGLIQQADGGTLFLDEIGDMPLHLQTRLLRVLAEQEVMPLGSEKPIKVNIRVIAASHRDLRQLIERGEFREDLYYRLNGAILRLPALRERADKSYLIERIFRELCEQRQRPSRIRGDAMSALLGYAWPGNIRELRNALQYALATAETDEITVNDLPEECLPSVIPRQAMSSVPVREQQTSHAREIEDCLRRQRWNVSAAARELSMSRPTLYRWMKLHNIVAPNDLDS
ncbi:sigma-54-dependent Fis family transcriptional regulator [Pseudomonas sp. B21-040]|uniref:sigma-54-dependent Fis family transcriptional regulator n=1 Tax=Pseudomonas sp. B21-040 TaxID=2895486 RepID=UPI0021602D5A|nr:sigma-54-dependent Fis family transcriptional regulator [Pseudomonas sp. B21-040]UVL43125.1 sigma-54-dependent Fis family transcriptional regulator [Pseudomonas sp. B21-040]